MSWDDNGGRGGKKSNPSKKKILIFFFIFFLNQSAKNISSLLYIYNLLLYQPARLPTISNISSRRLAHITSIAANHTVQKQSDDACQNTYKEN